MSRPEPIEILGVDVDPLTVDMLHQGMQQIVDAGGHELILNVNIHCLNLAYSRPWMRDVLNQAAYVFCDGAGVMLGARMLGRRIPVRITYSDWIWQLAAWCDSHGHSLFFLGDEEDIVAAAAQRLRDRFPALRVAGAHDGFFDKSPDSPENRRVVEEINRHRPTVLLVGFGMPLQERWLGENWDRIDANIGLTCGGAFRVLAGKAHRCPPWMAKHGLEWLARLVYEPRRVWRRYLLGNPLFVWRVALQRLGLRNKAGSADDSA